MAITKERLSISLDKLLAGSLRQIALDSGTDVSNVCSVLIADGMAARDIPVPSSRSLSTKERV
jgi:hypothetical protein